MNQAQGNNVLFMGLNRKKRITLALLSIMAITILISFPQVGFAATSATIQFNQSQGQRSPNVFGGSINQLDGASDVDSLRSVGISFARRDVYLSQILPNTTVAQYLADMSVSGGVDDPNNWDWSQYGWVDTYHNKGLKTMIILSYNVGWLSSNNANNGVPKNWTVYEDIIKKITQRFQGKIDFIEVWNEPDLAQFLDISNSGYANSLAAYKAIYTHAANAVRSVNATIPIGGPSLSTTDTSWANALLQDANTKPNVNFLSYHHYQMVPNGEPNIQALRNVASVNGVSNMPIYITEWNWDWQYIGSSMNNDSTHAIPYVAQRLNDMIWNNVAGTGYFAFNKQTTHPDFYSIYSNGSLTPKMNTYRVLAKQLGLGAGAFTLRGSTWVNGAASIVAGGATNSSGNPVAWVVNTSTSVGDNLNFNFNGLKANTSYVAAAYEASLWQNGTAVSFTTSFTTNASGNATISFWTPYESVIGIKLTEQAPSPGAVSNGSFESPTTSNFAYRPLGATWTFTGDAGIQRNGGDFGASAAPLGVQTAFVQNSGTMSQLVSLTAGTYKVAFKAAKRTSYGGTQTFNVMFDSTLIGTYTPSTGTFATFSTNNFAASAGPHTISFVGTTTGDNTDFIDDVVLSAV
ncbi:cellulase family glycosylhydrolase [Cohnella sp. GbtcB17]|uniref:GH39 family glycosyl hydrolase n=1 Tax=Cohnella sp. GbtcB17 TaxID=2824762 RepID=UPI001C2F6AEA|nr:cellulase family glycosylhydrolase [Cohnella sp. GbtcB17]